MKTAEAKTASPALQRKANKPFFGKGSDSFFSSESASPQNFFSNNSDNFPAFAAGKPVQAKLTIGKPNDHYEREADSMADKVVQRLANGDVQQKENQSIQRKRQSAASSPILQKCACNGEGAKDKEDEKVQKKEQNGGKELESLSRKPIFESDNEAPVQRKAISTEAPLTKGVNKLSPVTKLNAAPAPAKTTVQTKCSACEAEEKLQKKEGEKEEPEKLQMKPMFATEAEESVQRKANNNEPSKLPQQNNIAPVKSFVITPVISKSTVQAKCSACEAEEKLQKKEGENEEQEPLQLKPIFAGDATGKINSAPGTTQTIQRACRECEEGHKILMKPIAGIQRTIHDQTPKRDGSRTSILAAAKGEIGQVEAGLNDGTGRRVGAERLLEYFHIAAPGVWDDSIIETAGAEMPSWCGIFSVWAHKKAGKDIGNWQMGKGVSAFGTLTQTDDPQPGDIGYINMPNQHHAVVKEIDGDTVHTIDGNSGLNKEVIENSKPRSEYTGFLTAFGGGSSSGNVQTKEDSGSAAAEASSSIESRINSSKGAGSVLPEATRQDMEQSFGADFSSVRIHTDSSAVQMSRDLNAQAFTHGSDIYFNSGKYDTGSDSGKHLLAHELTHTLQQGGATHSENVQRYSWDEFTDDLSDAADTVTEGLSDAADAVVDTASDVGEAIVDTGAAAIETVSEAASAALDWLSTQAGQAFQALADALGVSVTVTANGLEIRVPGRCPLPAFTQKFVLDTISKDWMKNLFQFPIGPGVTISGDVGLVGHITPEVQVQLGPVCFDDLVITINPLTGSGSVSGGISMTNAASLGAEIRGGVRGELNLEAIVIVGGIPVKIEAPLVGVEGGLAGMIRGIAAQRFHYGGTLSYGSGIVTASPEMNLDLGLGADLFAGAYAQLDVSGENVCRIYWQPIEWHGGIAYSLGLSADVTIDPLTPPGIDLTLNPPTLDEIPFDSIPLAINREGFSDDCPILDRICDILRALGLLPSQNGGVWDWNGTGHGGSYGPGPRLRGPLDVYQTDPGIPSTATCRGACGPNCDTCEPPKLYHFTDPTTGQTWEYLNYRECNSNEGCRQHDAAFDWAAAEKGEAGDDWSIVLLPWHMAANIECTCENLAGNCIAWIIGLPPYDMKMYFADDAYPISSVDIQGECQEQNPDFTNCTWEGADRDEVLELWGMDHGYENFRNCAPHRNFPAGVIQACDLGPGRTWHCTATDVETGEDVTISIFECYCCDETGASGSDYRSPHLSVRGAYDDATSRQAPIISERAFQQAQNHIRAGRNALALQVVVDDLVAGGHMNPSLYTIRYVHRSDKGEGETSTEYVLDPATGDYLPDGPSEVEIYTPGFTSVQWLVSTVMHEYQHVLQDQRPQSEDQIDDPTGEHLEVAELEAYLWELEHSDLTGMAAQTRNMRDTMNRCTDHYDNLGGINPARQAQYTVRYDKAVQFVADLQEAPPPLPGYPHVFHHGSDYDTIEAMRTAVITATGSVDFGEGFYTHTKNNWRLAREWAIRHSLGKKGWGVITFPVPNRPWSEVIRSTLYFRNTRSQPRNIPINPDTGRKFKDWYEFVQYNKRKKREGALPHWREFDVIEGPLWGRLSRTPNIHQVMFTESGVRVLNRSDVMPLRIVLKWLFLRFR